jgi:hypothetical protein
MIGLRVARYALGLCLIPGVVGAQSEAQVKGRIVAADSTPLSGALVELLATGDSARTSATGEFLLPRVSVGPQTLRIRMLGYSIKQVNILVIAGTGWTGTIALEPGAVTLPEVAVTSRTTSPRPTPTRPSTTTSSAVASSGSAPFGPRGDRGQGLL